MKGVNLVVKEETREVAEQEEALEVAVRWEELVLVLLQSMLMVKRLEGVVPEIVLKPSLLRDWISHAYLDPPISIVVPTND